MKKSIAIQGIKGSFHHQVALDYFGDNLDILECMSFDSAVDCLLDENADAMVMALENSIAGSILPNYALIHTNDLYIVGEYYLDIQHHLMALPRQSISDIVEVRLHPMALLQCKTFFKNYPHIKLVEAKDTAAIAKQIYKGQLRGLAAVAGQTAAELYQLSVVAESIQTIKKNETRFVIVKRDKHKQDNTLDINKASLMFELSHKRGSLAAILNVMSDCKLNLTKIQSLPKIETPWQYAFFVDVTFESLTDYKKAIAVLELMAENLKVLGAYKNAKL